MGLEDTYIGCALVDMCHLIETGITEAQEIRTRYRQILESYPDKDRIEAMMDALFQVTDRKYRL